MMALPGETVEDVALTLRLIARLAKTAKESPFPISYRKYIPLPKTRLFEYAVEEFDLSMPRNVGRMDSILRRIYG